MLRKLLFVFVTVAALTSCKKDKGDSGYNLSAKVDGNRVEFNTAVSASRSGDDVIITGFGGSVGTPFPAFTIYLDDDAPIAAKTYTAADGDATSIYAASSGQSSYSSDDDFTVTVSSITSSEVKGSFSGKVDNGSGIKTISEGTFSAKFQ